MQIVAYLEPSAAQDKGKMFAAFQLSDASLQEC
jgi:hypothetical protein